MVKLLHRVGWIGLTVIGALLAFGVTADLVGDARDGLPADHAGVFTALAGRTFADLRQNSPGTAHYVTTLEVGYALHELAFVLLFLALVLKPVRLKRIWGWWACWAVLVATFGYTFTLARHDPVILSRSLVADIAVPLLLLACAPAVFRRH